MLGEYDSFLHHLRLCGDVVCGKASSSASSSSGDEPDGGAVWHVALVTTTAADATSMCRGGAVAADHQTTTSPPSLNVANFPSASAGSGARGATRDTLLVLVTNFYHHVFAGSLNYDSLRFLAHLDVDVPSSAFLPLLFQAIRSTALHAAGASSDRLGALTLGRVGGQAASSSSNGSRSGGGGGGTTAAPPLSLRDTVLVVDIRGALRRRFSVSLTPLESEHQRKAAHSFLCAALMMAHTQVSWALERERVARREADDRLQTVIANGGATGPPSGSGGTPAVPSNARKIQRPPSLVNPQAKGPQKRPRGVKFS